MDYIEFLEANNASNELINKVMDIVVKLNDDDYRNFLSKLEFVYDMFAYIGFSNDEVNDFLNNFYNVGILRKDKKEIIKIIYVLNRVGVQRLITDINEPLKNGLLYKRIFMRDFYLKLKNGYDYRIGLGLLSTSEIEAYGTKYRLGVKTITEKEKDDIPKYTYDLVKGNKVIPSISSDKELEDFLDKIIIVNDKHYTVDEYIKIASNSLYRKYLQSKLNGKQK